MNLCRAKDEILNKLKNDGLSVADAATNYGIHTATIYNWLGTKAKGVVSILEHNKLKKENEQLKHIGDLTIKMSVEAKKGLSRGW